jgi:outer membrane protein
MKTSIINGLILSTLTLSPLANQADDFIIRGGQLWLIQTVINQP